MKIPKLPFSTSTIPYLVNMFTPCCCISWRGLKEVSLTPFSPLFFTHVFALQVHPNPDCTCYQHFELAGKLVGKSLLEGALGNTLPLKVNFSQSFLAQVLGLKVGYCVSQGQVS